MRSNYLLAYILKKCLHVNVQHLELFFDSRLKHPTCSIIRQFENKQSRASREDDVDSMNKKKKTIFLCSSSQT